MLDEFSPGRRMGYLRGGIPQCPAAWGHTWAGLQDDSGSTGQVEFVLCVVQGAVIPIFTLEIGAAL